ncbi:LamG domain-containing protein [Candidatus Poribacteria bacterium]|nr:LamG domain-containing protein [Candidatus Poribacteria bacterium]
MRNIICILIVTIFGILTLPNYMAAADDIIFHFPFDEGNGDTTNDKSNNKFKGTIKNAEWVEGVVGEALEFNNGFVNVDPFGVDVPDEMTIEMWFKPTEKIAGGGRIDLLYRQTGGGRPHFTFNRGGLLFGCYVATNAVEFQVISTYTAFDPQWYYLVLTQDQDKAIVYIDGKKDAEENAGGAVRMDFSANGMCIAANQGNSNFFNGTIDEVKMRNVALSAEDVKKNMDQALAVDANDKLTTTWGDLKSRL